MIKRPVKLKCSILNEFFITNCETAICGDMENPLSFRVTGIFPESCPFYQEQRCPDTSCVFANGTTTTIYKVVDQNAI